MNLPYFRSKMRGNVENKNNNPVNIRFNNYYNNNDILLRTHGPYHRHKNTKSG